MICLGSVVVIVFEYVVTLPASVSGFIDSTENHSCVAACPEVMHVLCTCVWLRHVVHFITPVAVCSA